MAAIRGGADRMDRLAIVEALAGFPSRLAEAAREAARRPVPAGEWGPGEVVRHLIAVEREVWWARLGSIRHEDEPRWSWTEPGPEPGLEDAPLDEVLSRFADARARTVGIVEGFDAATWDRTGVHATYGRLDVAGLLRLATDHDAEHLGGLAPAGTA
jgi:hypothetical protein